MDNFFKSKFNHQIHSNFKAQTLELLVINRISLFHAFFNVTKINIQVHL